MYPFERFTPGQRGALARCSVTNGPYGCSRVRQTIAFTGSPGRSAGPEGGEHEQDRRYCSP